MGEAAGQDGAHVMSKEEFLAELEACLSDLSKEEQEEALAYYQDYLEEAGDEPDVLGRLGTPQQVADGIRMGLEQDVDAGEFTESGYRDGRLEEAAKTPDRYTVLMKKESAQGSEKTSKDHGAEEETEKGNGNSWSRERFESFGRQARQTWEEAKQDALENGQSRPGTMRRRVSGVRRQKMPGKRSKDVPHEAEKTTKKRRRRRPSAKRAAMAFYL